MKLKTEAGGNGWRLAALADRRTSPLEGSVAVVNVGVFKLSVSLATDTAQRYDWLTSLHVYQLARYSRQVSHALRSMYNSTYLLLAILTKESIEQAEGCQDRLSRIE